MVRTEPNAGAFAATYEAGRAQLVWTRRVSDLDTPVSALVALGFDGPGGILLESVEGGAVRGRYSILAGAPDLIWRVRGTQPEIARDVTDFTGARFEPDGTSVRESLERLLAGNIADMPADLPPPAAGLFGYLGYEMVHEAERLPRNAPDPLGLPVAMLVRPSLVAVFDSVRQETTLVTPVRPQAGLSAAHAYASAQQRLVNALAKLDGPRPAIHPGHGEAGPVPEPVSNLADTGYRAAVDRIRDYARAGDIFQTVPSQRYSASFPLEPLALYRALRRVNPSPFLYYLNYGAFSVVGASPEILVRVRDREMTVRPIAGTRPRGKTPADDKALEAELLADPKEISEHLMLLDLGRNDVGRVCQPGSVEVTASFSVERYSHVMHIVSNVVGRLRDDCGPVDALFAGFPAGTVSGAPKVRAMEIISELEPHGRGIYAGAVGYFSVSGDLDTCIALRTAVLKDGQMHVQAGGGIVLDSDRDAEHMETVHKARALFRAAAEAYRFSG